MRSDLLVKGIELTMLSKHDPNYRIPAKLMQEVFPTPDGYRSSKVNPHAKRDSLIKIREKLSYRCKAINDLIEKANYTRKNDLWFYKEMLENVDKAITEVELPRIKKEIQISGLKKRTWGIINNLGPSFTTEQYFMESLLDTEGQARAYLRSMVKKGRLVEIKPNLFVKHGDHYQAVHYDASKATVLPKEDGTFAVTVSIKIKGV